MRKAVAGSDLVGAVLVVEWPWGRRNRRLGDQATHHSAKGLGRERQQAPKGRVAMNCLCLMAGLLRAVGARPQMVLILGVPWALAWRWPA